jgi:dienelactone hydrolase
MPRRVYFPTLLALCVLACGALEANAMPQEPRAPAPRRLPEKDTRASVPPRDLNTRRAFPGYATRAEWETRRDYLCRQIRISLGLYPLPPRPPLKARIFDRVERDGYTIEKVYFQTHPGFYLAGNLYRPFGKQAKAPYPGVLVAHGHWGNGRMANEKEGSISARAITFARQGYVAFTYDMVGYNDTMQISHSFANTLRHWLHGVSLMGLQTWNSMRALDFLCSLRDVDKKRLAISGESGGGTQTMLLGALEDRLTAVAPCVMVSHTMQGGCLCENAPGLRVDFFNVDIAAAAAPKYQIIVGASGDWTASTMTMEGPSVASIYQMLGVPDRMEYVLFNAPHNINQASREAVYSFFGKHFFGGSDPARFKEPPYQMEPAENLRVFPNKQALPPDAKSAEALTDYLIQIGQEEIEKRKPKDKRTLMQFQKFFRPVWEHTLSVEIPAKTQLLSSIQLTEQIEEGTCTRLSIGREGKGDCVPAALFMPTRPVVAPVVVLAHPQGRAALMNLQTDQPGPLVASLLAKRHGVLILDTFLTGERADAGTLEARKVPFTKYFSTYNRTNLQERVQDILTACAYLRTRPDVISVKLAGLEEAGLWALLAAPAADAVAADAHQLDLTSDEALLTDDLFVPCLRRMGDFRTSAALAAPHPLLLHHTGAKFTASTWLREVYQAVGKPGALWVTEDKLGAEALVEWLINSVEGKG